MPWRERHDDNLAAPAPHLLRANDGRLVVVAAFDENVGTERADQCEGGILVEDDYGVHRLERGKNVTPFGDAAHGTRRALEPLYRFVAVDAYDEGVPKPPCSDQHINVARMEQVEHTVREHEPPATLAAPSSGLVPIEYFVERLANSAQSGPSACG